MREIKTVTILGANGTMGAGSAGVIAAFGNAKVYTLARTTEKAKEGIEKAVNSVRTDTIRERLIPGNYDDDLARAVADSDWVFELVAEDYTTKEDINKKIAQSRKPGTIVSTVSSGLSIAKLAKAFGEEGEKFYCGTHFFNPPYKMVLCELVSHEKSDKKLIKELGEYLEKKLVRAVVYTHDKPAFAGNRIGFQFINEVAQKAEEFADKGGIALLDSILSGYTGRSMPPLATADFVGLDVHKAIVDNLYQFTNDHARKTFLLPKYFQELISSGSLGAKTKKGLFQSIKDESTGKKSRLVYDIQSKNYVPYPKFSIDFINNANQCIRESNYNGAMNIVKEAKGFEADLARYFIARYISYSFSIIGEVVDSKEMVDLAMGFGFNWAPASSFVDFLGGTKETIKFIEKAKLPIPEVLTKFKGKGKFYELTNILDARSLFKG